MEQLKVVVEDFKVDFESFIPTDLFPFSLFIGHRKLADFLSISISCYKWQHFAKQKNIALNTLHNYKKKMAGNKDVCEMIFQRSFFYE